MREEMLWVEKYRPRKIEDCILPARLKAPLAAFVAAKKIPNLLLTGKAGVGKTTVARAMLEEGGYDYIIINSSKDGNIDTLRNKVTQFASSVSMTGTRKYVILDEADGLNPQSTQPALRNFIEEYSINCGFIMTCNFPNRILEPLRSRMTTIDFATRAEEKPPLMMEFAKRMMTVLEAEGVTYEKNALFEVVGQHFPDFRKTINELQGYSTTGKIDSGMLSVIKRDMGALAKLLKARDIQGMRKWVAAHADEDAIEIMRQVYDECESILVPSSEAAMVILIGEYQFKHAFVADSEINLHAFLIAISMECEFK